MEEIMETVGTAVEEVAETVVEKGGISFGKATGVVAGIAVVATGVYLAVKYVKNKKAKKAEAASKVVTEEDFEETAETAEN